MLEDIFSLDLASIPSQVNNTADEHVIRNASKCTGWRDLGED